MNTRRLPISLSITGVTLMLCLLGCGDTATEPVIVSPMEGLVGFDARLDSIRAELRIPGMAAAIARDGQIVWSRGFGWADVERGRAATDTTSFYTASVTKSIAAILLMQLVQEGSVDLDDPISQYGIDLESDAVITVRHLMNHTSEGLPGNTFSYNGNRYIPLEDVMIAASGLTFAQLLTERILDPLNLRHTAPDINLIADFVATGLNRPDFLANVAMPYELVGGQVVPSGHPRHFSPAAGLIASVRDLAAISIALDQDRLLDVETKNLMLSPSVSIDGDALNYGLGWFVQTYEGVTLEWHGGEWNAQSALLLRVPDMALTFVAVANTRRMSGAYRMGSGDVMESGVARLFVESFVLGNDSLPANP